MAAAAGEVRAKSQEQHLELVSVCSHCEKLAKKISFCGRCRIEGYCSEEHQRAAWPKHRLVCVAHPRFKLPQLFAFVQNKTFSSPFQESFLERWLRVAEQSRGLPPPYIQVTHKEGVLKDVDFVDIIQIDGKKLDSVNEAARKALFNAREQAMALMGKNLYILSVEAEGHQSVESSDYVAVKVAILAQAEKEEALARCEGAACAIPAPLSAVQRLSEEQAAPDDVVLYRAPEPPRDQEAIIAVNLASQRGTSRNELMREAVERQHAHLRALGLGPVLDGALAAAAKKD